MEKHLAENMSTAIFAVPKNEWPVRLRARTPPFHGGDTGSNPVRATKKALNYFKAFLFIGTIFDPEEQLRYSNSITSIELTLLYI